MALTFLLGSVIWIGSGCVGDPIPSTVKPWRVGEVVQTIPKDLRPWDAWPCDISYCDPAPTFKIILSSPTGEGYDLLDVIYPEDSETYKKLLLDPMRTRRCEDHMFSISRCSFFQEYVFFSGNSEPLAILSSFDKNYDNVYQRMGTVTMENKYETLEENVDDADNAKDTAQETDSDDILIYVLGIVFVIVACVFVCGFIVIRRNSSRTEESEESEIVTSPLPAQRRVPSNPTARCRNPGRVSFAPNPPRNASPSTPRRSHEPPAPRNSFYNVVNEVRNARAKNKQEESQV